MRRAVACLALAMGLASCAMAAPPLFVTSLEQARQEAQKTGKHIFVYFNLPG